MAGRTAFPHLHKRPKGLFSWRRRWPRNAAPARDVTSRQSAFLCFSLRTDFPTDAKALARRLTALSDPVFAAVTGKIMPLDRATAELLLTDLVRFEIEASDRARAVAPFRPIEVAEAEAAREAALQATLRRAIFLRDRDVARAPLREVAARLGLELDETGPEWLSLAIEATRVLLDISEERARRDRGVFCGQAPAFRSAMHLHQHHAVAVAIEPSTMTTVTSISPQAWFGASNARTAPDPDPHAGTSAAVTDSTASDEVHNNMPIDARAAFETENSPKKPDRTPGPLAAPHPAAPACTMPTTPKRAASKDKEYTLDAGFLAYIEARSAGKSAKRIDEPANVKEGESWSRQSGPNVQGTRRLMGRFFGDRPLASMTEKDMSDFFTVLQHVPANHGKSPEEQRDLRDLVATADAEEAGNATKIRLEGTMSGMSPGNIEAAIAIARVRRVRMNTVYRHMQDTKRMFRYMVALGRIASNPMDNVIWPKKTLDRLLALEEDEGRLPWEREQLTSLFRSP
ncbi:MAG: hypothetical protein Q4G49_06875, partial [Paracoccus sp. (in: a-proteobacteria)]|nr:hypothetical protein [Paracoccus sp. (in: a-proteobacteria)]